MNISNKEKTNRSRDKYDGKSTTTETSQKVREAMNEHSPAWDAQEGTPKRHGDKEADHGPPQSTLPNEENESEKEGEYNDDANAEYMDHQDINESKDDDFDQPQPMSEGLRSIYPGRPSTKEERNAVARERREAMNVPGNRKQSTESDKLREKNIQKGDLGIARGEVPSGHRDPNFSPARQNDWDNASRGSEPYGDYDHNDREVQRREDEGRRPWETSSDLRPDGGQGDDNENRKKHKIRRQEEGELDRHLYQNRNEKNRAQGRKQQYTGDNE